MQHDYHDLDRVDLLLANLFVKWNSQGQADGNGARILQQVLIGQVNIEVIVGLAVILLRNLL